MPKKLHERLEKSAKKRGLTGKRKAAYVYGTMRMIEKDASKKVSKS